MKRALNTQAPPRRQVELALALALALGVDLGVVLAALVELGICLVEDRGEG